MKSQKKARHYGKELLALALITSCSTPQLNDQSNWLTHFDQWDVVSPNKNYSIQRDEVIDEKNEPSLRFELRKGDGWINKAGELSYRAEVIPGDYPALDSIQWYGCDLRLPSDFPIENNRLVLMQWWPKTKKELGEVGRSPSLALRFVDGKLYATVRSSELRVIKDPDSVKAKTIFETTKMPLGIWNKFIFQVKWSYKKGFVKIWWNDHQVANHEGPVGYNDDIGPIFKFGMYRDDSDKTYIAHFAQCSQGDSLEAIQARASVK